MLIILIELKEDVSVKKIKKENIMFWTVNVPGIDNQVNRDNAGSLEFYKKVDEVRYEQEAYIFGFKWIRTKFQDYLSKRYDNTPLSRIYSSKELKKLFKRFKNINIDVAPKCCCFAKFR